jgi:hypothetical protein
MFHCKKVRKLRKYEVQSLYWGTLSRKAKYSLIYHIRGYHSHILYDLHHQFEKMLLFQTNYPYFLAFLMFKNFDVV